MHDTREKQEGHKGKRKDTREKQEEYKGKT